MNRCTSSNHFSFELWHYLVLPQVMLDLWLFLTQLELRYQSDDKYLLNPLRKSNHPGIVVIWNTLLLITVCLSLGDKALLPFE